MADRLGLCPPGLGAVICERQCATGKSGRRGSPQALWTWVLPRPCARPARGSILASRGDSVSLDAVLRSPPGCSEFTWTQESGGESKQRVRQVGSARPGDWLSGLGL